MCGWFRQPLPSPSRLRRATSPKGGGKAPAGATGLPFLFVGTGCGGTGRKTRPLRKERGNRNTFRTGRKTRPLRKEWGNRNTFGTGRKTRPLRKELFNYSLFTIHSPVPHPFRRAHSATQPVILSKRGGAKRNGTRWRIYAPKTCSAPGWCVDPSMRFA